MTQKLLRTVRVRTLALLVGAVLAVSPMAYGYFAGGGKDAAKGNDCLIGYDGISRADVSLDGKQQVVRCTDCDPECDLDGTGTADGSCTFKVEACINQSGVEGCAPPARLTKASASAKVKGVKGKVVIEVPQSLEGPTCGALVELVVPVARTRKGAKDGKGTVRLSASLKKNKAEEIGARSDKDSVTFVCQPREGACPVPTTTTPTSSTTTSTTTTMPLPCSFVTKWGTGGTGDGEFDNSSGIAVESGGIYVADTVNQRIQKFTDSGAFLTKWGTGGTGDGQFANPYGVAARGGNVYVADTNNNRIQKFTDTGAFVTKWGSFGSGDGQFFGPTSVAVDSSGNVYVADRENQRIQKFTDTGMFVTKWGSLGSGDGQFMEPTGVAVDGTDQVYVADQYNDRIQKFTDTGSFLMQWSILGADPSCPGSATGVAVDSGGHVYVADQSNARIQEFTDTGTFLTMWGSYGVADGQFQNPVGVAVDGSGNIYVVELFDRVQKFFPCP